MRGANVIVPAATTDYTANTIQGGGGTDMTASMSVAATIYSTWTKLVVSNTHATLGFYIILLKVRGNAITQTPTPIRISDAASQAAYGKRELTFDVPWQQSVNTATDLANTLKTFYAAPKTPMICMLDNVLPALLDYELCDRTTVTIAEYGINQVMQLHALSLKTGKTMQDVKAELSPGASG